MLFYHDYTEKMGFYARFPTFNPILLQRFYFKVTEIYGIGNILFMILTGLKKIQWLYYFFNSHEEMMSAKIHEVRN